MFRNRFLPLAALWLAFGCSSDLAHEAPFDPDSPLTMQAKASLTGAITLEGETDFGGVALRLVNADRAYDFTTANDGLVELPGIVPGTYKLTVSTRYFQPVEREVTFGLGERKSLDTIALELSTAKVTGSALARAIRDQEEVLVGGVKLVFTRKGNLRQGGAAGAPMFAAAASAATQTTTYTTYSNADGTYSLDAVDAGVYEITASNDEVAAQAAGEVTVTGEGDVAVEDVLLQPLAGFFTIRGTGAEGNSELYTGTASVTLQLNAIGADKVKIGSSADGTKAGCAFPNAAVSLNGNLTPAYTIPAPGLHTVCVRFVDAAGAETDTLRGSIIYDNAAPKLASALINDGALASSSLSVGMRFSAVETETTLHAYQVANTVPADWNAQPKYAYQPNILHTLAGDGLQTVYARFQDAAGNWTGVVSASIEVSTVAPTGVAGLTDDLGNAILAGETTRSSRVYVASTITSQTTLQMQVSTSGSYTGVAWEPYAAAKAVDLPPQVGSDAVPRQVMARVRDAVGRVVDLLDVNFMLDGRGPTGTVSATAALMNSFDVPLVFTVNDLNSVIEIAENPSFVDSLAFAYQAATTYTLVSQTDGPHTLYVRFVDAAGNASALASAVVQVDTTPPQLAALSIRQGTITNSRTVDLDLTALDAAEMSIAEAATCSNTWVAYAATKQHTFALDVDGDKTIAVKFRDAALNETACLTKTITYDQTPPVPGAFQINAGAQYARDRAVTLSIAVADATEMQIAETPVFSGAWQPVTTTVSYTLSAGEGAKTLYVQFRDLAGNTALATPATIQLDTVAPEQPLVTVNDGSGYARQVTATLTLSATGSPSHYRWTVDGVIDNKAWLPFTTSTSVSLGAGADGARTVAVQFKDAADNVSLVAQANVELDREVPASPSIRIDDGAATTRDSAGLVTLTLNASDTGSGLDTVRLAPTQAGLASAAPLSFEPTKIYTLDNYTVDGVKPVWVSIYDKAGNYSTPVSAVIKLDRTPPSAVLSLPAGSLSPNGIVPIDIAADADTVEMQVWSVPGPPPGPWEPFESSLTHTFQLVEGPATFYVRLRDDAGNDSPPFTIGVTLDLTPPVMNGVSAAVISDTLVWDDLNPDTVSYQVYLFDDGVAKSVTPTTEKRLFVGRMNPGFTVVAKYADGTTSAFSQPPGYAVPPTVAAFIGLTAGGTDNALLARLAQQYGLGTTTAGCGQVVFTTAWNSDDFGPSSPAAGGTGSNGGPRCPGSNPIRLMGDAYSQSAPPFDANIAAAPGNPFAGLPPLRISGGGRTYYYAPSNNANTPILTVPGWLKWDGASYALATTGDVIASLGRFDPASGTGENEIRLFVPLAAMAVTDDAAFTYTPSTTATPQAYGYLGSQGLAFSTAGRFAGIDVTDVTFRNRYYEGYISMNGLAGNANPYYMAALPGTIRVPIYATDGTTAGQVMAVSSIWPYCNWTWDPILDWQYVCDDYGQSVELDAAASTLTLLDHNPQWNDDWREFSVTNADGSRSYRLPFPNDGVTTFYWRNEYDQPAAEGYLRAMLRRLAAPIRVRGTGTPVLSNQVAGATEMLVGLDAAFSGAQWQAYADETTLPEGTQTVWVRYRDDAGNVTAAQEIPIAAPEVAPRVDEAVILGEAGNPGYTTGENVTAYLIGSFPSDVAVRVSTSPTFDDEGWIDVGGPLTELEFTDPLTGEKEKADLDGYQVVRIPLTIPAAPGTYQYYFWAKDASRNFSRGVQAAVIFDTTEPEAEFSLKPGGPGEVQIQAQWTVTKSQVLPSLASLSPTPVTAFTLPFSVPFIDTASSQLWIDDTKACLLVGYLSACPLEKLENIKDHSVTITAQQAVVVWRGTGPYGTAVTTAATVAADGSVRLSYWNTGARINMYGQVDMVETPYADFDYAAILGSVEYLPNELPLQFLLRSQTGEIEKIKISKRSVQVEPDGYWQVQSPWKSVGVEDRGVVRYTGTAYSLAGAAGRVTVRDVYVRDGDWDDAMLDNAKAVALSDTRRWAYWDLGDDNYTTAFRVEGVRAEAGTLIATQDDTMVQVAEAHQRVNDYYSRGRSAYPNSPMQGRRVPVTNSPALVVVDDAAVPTSGVPVTPDFDARLLYGADGSFWDMADPRRPVAVRAYAGSYPYSEGSALRVGRYVWTGAGVYDVSSPENPVKVADAHSPKSAFAAFQGKVYEVAQWQFWVYDAAYPATAPTTGSFSTYSAGWNLFNTGGRLLSSQGDLIGVDLTLPTADSFYYAGLGYNQAYVDADARSGFWNPMAGLGFVRYYADGYAVYPRLKDEAGFAGTPLLWEVRGLQAEGPWIFGTGADTLHVGHIGRALPDQLTRFYTNASSSAYPQVAVDAHYVYVCDNTTLSLYSLQGSLVKSGTVKGCNKPKVTYPYVIIGNSYRYRVDGATIVEAPLEFCDPFASAGSCPQGERMGTAWKDWSRKIWIGTDLLVPLGDTNCEPSGATDSLLLCYDWGTGDIKAAPFAELRYRGIVTSQVTLPLVKLLNDGNQVVDAAGEYFATNAGTYFVEGLQSVVRVGPGPVQFVAPGFASDDAGNLFVLDGPVMRRVAKVSTNGVVRVSPAGVLATAYGNSAWITKWGPGLPEYRKTMPNSALARDIVSAAGYVYMATPGGVARSDGLMQVAQADARYDVTVRHTGNAWTLVGRDRRAVTTVVEAAPGGSMADLCDTTLVRPWTDPENPWNPPFERVCHWNENVTTGTVFEGDLGGQWLGLRGVSVDAVGDVSSLAVDLAGRVYAGVQTSATATGVYMYDPIDTSLSAVDFLPTGPVLDLAVTDDTLYVLLANTDLVAYDLKNAYAVKWTQVGTNYVRIRATPGWLAAGGDGWGPVIIDPATGGQTSWCGAFGGEFEFSTRRWGGTLHTVLIGVGGSSVSVIDAQTCAQVEWLDVNSAVDLRYLRRQNGFLLMGDGEGLLHITQEGQFGKPHVFTIVQGPEPIEQAVLVGPFIYTIGDGSGQIFQLH